MAPEADFDAEPLLETLARHRVAYVLIGGLAAVARGSPQITFDLDICYRRTRDNLETLAMALRELDAVLRGAPEGVPFLLDAETLERGDHFTFATSSGALDILGTPAGTKGYDDLAQRAERLRAFGHELLVASIDDLIAMKRAAGRKKDVQALAYLEAIRDRLPTPERPPA